MNFAMLKTFLPHRIATKTSAKNADSGFGLAATILGITKLFFFKTLLELFWITRCNSVGNIDVRILERGDTEEIEQQLRYKLKAAKGEGWICQADHSVSNDVAPESYDVVII